MHTDDQAHQTGRPGCGDQGLPSGTKESPHPVQLSAEPGLHQPLVYFNHYQALWVDPCDEKRNWGFFGQYGISDGNPNPIEWVANFGFGGHSPIRCRNYDTFGIGFFYSGVSDEFKTLTAPVVPQRDEHGAEIFCNYAIMPWCRLTGDLQVARPSTVGIDTVWIAGTRLQVLF